jgi:hypothetical protein
MQSVVDYFYLMANVAWSLLLLEFAWIALVIFNTVGVILLWFFLGGVRRGIVKALDMIQ